MSVEQISKEKTLDELCAQWLEAKMSEDAQREYRIELEREILAVTGAREEGAETTEAGHFKVTTTARLTRKVDWKKWDALDIPKVMEPVKHERKLDLVGLRWLERNEPDLYRVILSAITTKPAKTAVKVEPLKEE